MGEIKQIKDVSTREQVLRYVRSEAGEVTLTPTQQELMEKWRYVDELIKKGEIRTREKLALHIMDHFSVSRDTAFRYMANAEYVWSSSYPMNKRYEIALRIDFVKEKIDVLYEKKCYKEAVSLEKVLKDYLDAYPQLREKQRPTKTIFNIGTLNMQVLAVSVAEQKADDIIKTYSEDDI